MEDYENTNGDLSAKIPRNNTGDICHFRNITEWEDIKSAKNYAGKDYQKAKYYPFDEKYLLHREAYAKPFKTFTD